MGQEQQDDIVKGVNFRMCLEDWQRLKVLAARQNTTLQELIERGLNIVLEKEGEKPLSRKK